MVILPVPRKSNGLIDEEEIFKLAYCRLGLPYSTLDDITFVELRWLLEGETEVKQEQYEMIAYAVQVGYARVKTGKKIEMFKKPNKTKVKSITKEEKQQKLNELDEIFGG